MIAENNDTIKWNLANFKLSKTLNNNASRKIVTVLGIFPDVSDVDQAIVILEKTAFSENDLDTNPEENATSYFTTNTKVETEFVNNVYGSFHCYPPIDINRVKLTVIYPATEKHIEKYSSHEKYILLETPDLYKNITEPHLKSEQLSLEWVYNILEHKKEKDRIIFEDPDPENGFILLPDLKWDGKTIETLYMLAITHKRNIKSLRDLTGTHIPLLKNIKEAGCEAIEKKFQIPISKLRVYFHYQPSFYHLHVHFNAIQNEAPGIFCEKSHLLDTVINNIELMPDYYQKATLPFAGYEGDKLLEKFQAEVMSRKRVKIDNLSEM